MTGKPEVSAPPLQFLGNSLVLTEFGELQSGYIKGTISISQGAISAKQCLPTPFDFNNLQFVAALSRQRPRVRVPSSPPFKISDLHARVWISRGYKKAKLVHPFRLRQAGLTILACSEATIARPRLLAHCAFDLLLLGFSRTIRLSAICFVLRRNAFEAQFCREHFLPPRGAGPMIRSAPSHTSLSSRAICSA